MAAPSATSTLTSLNHQRARRVDCASVGPRARVAKRLDVFVRMERCKGVGVHRVSRRLEEVPQNGCRNGVRAVWLCRPWPQQPLSRHRLRMGPTAARLAAAACLALVVLRSVGAGPAELLPTCTVWMAGLGFLPHHDGAEHPPALDVS